MQRDGVMKTRADIQFTEMPLNLIALLHTNNIQMVYSAAPFGFQWCFDAPHLFQQVIVVFSRPSPVFVPFPEMRQLDAQNRGLQGVETAVISLNQVVIFLVLTVIPDHPNPLRKCFIIRCDSPTFAAGPKILAGIKTEPRSLSYGACL